MEPHDDPERLLSELTEECYATALRSWLKAHRGQRTSEEALAQDVVTRHIHLEISHRLGYLKATVTITCRRPWLSETYFYRYQRVRESAYVLVASPTSRAR